MTTWNFIDNKITNIQTHTIKTLQSNYVAQVKAGRYGKDKVFIIYSEERSGSYYGSISKGTIPKLYIIKLPNIKKIVDDKVYDKLLMNTNEDLRTFEDGVLIWATSNTEGKLTINKIGKTQFGEEYEELIEDDVDEEVEEESNGDLSGGAVAGIVIGSIGGAGGIGVGVFFLLRFLKNRNITPETPEPITQAKIDVTRYSNSRNNANSRINVNNKSSVNNNSTIRSLGKGKGKGKVKKKRKSINK